MNHLPLFSGIGGFELAAAWLGWNNVAQVEIDDFCQKVLRKNFPESIIFGDIKQFSYSVLKSYLRKKGIYDRTIDIISGGFPCQPFSVAGKRKGTADNRFLWDEMLRVVAEVRPKWVVAENVPGIITIENGLVFEKCCTDLESEGYEVQPFIIPAISKNAPHRRDRVWIVANTFSSGNGRREKQQFKNHGEREILQNKQKDGEMGCENQRCYRKFNDTSYSNCERKLQQSRLEQNQREWSCNCNTDFADTEISRCQRYVNSWSRRDRFTDNNIVSWERNWYEVATELCRVYDGSPTELYGINGISAESKKKKSTGRLHRLRALGNAIVPQIAYELFKVIDEIERMKNEN